MSMTRKDYKAIAKVLSAEHAIADDKTEITVQNIVASLADLFAQTNPRFERETFYIACLGRNYLREFKESSHV